MHRNLILVVSLLVTAFSQSAEAGCDQVDPKSLDQVVACVKTEARGSGEQKTVFGLGAPISSKACRGLTQPYVKAVRNATGLKRREVQVPSCETLARAVEEVSGRPVSWSACVGYNPERAVEHMKSCLEWFVPNYYSDSLAFRVPGCSEAVAEYERALKMAHEDRSLPTGYVPPDCAEIAGLTAEWSGKPTVASEEQEPEPQIESSPDTPAPSPGPLGDALGRKVSEPATPDPVAARSPAAEEAITKLDRRLVRIDSAIDASATTLLDAHIKLVKAWFGEEFARKRAELCFNVFDATEGHREAAERTAKLRGQRPYTPQYRDFEASIEYSQWQRRMEGRMEEKRRRCGWYFLDHLESNPKAPRYALAAFKASHNVDPTDDYSADVVAVLYRAGRGVQHNARRSDAWYAVAKKRKAIIAGEIGEPAVRKDVGRIYIDYGQVPEEFVPPLPEPPGDQQLQIALTKVTPNALREIDFGRFRRAILTRTAAYYTASPQLLKYGSGDSIVYARNVTADTDAALASNAYVVICQYNTEEFQIYERVRFWYDVRPGFAEPARLRSRAPDHPLLDFGDPIRVCPATLAAAKSLVPSHRDTAE